LADQLSTLVEIVSKKVVTPTPVKVVEESCVTCGGAHAWYNCPATDNNQASICATTGTYNQANLPNRVSNQMAPPGELNAYLNIRSGIAYEGPSIPNNHSPKKVVERETKETTDKEQTNSQGSTAQIPPSVIPISIPEPDVPTTLPKPTPILESDILKSLPKPIFHILHDVMIKSLVTKLRIKWRRSSKSFKICASTLVSRMLYF
ncbi:hypothetical protein Tco_0579209, partial [Tanacetum coccineum]